jgi:hypothetical protein
MVIAKGASLGGVQPRAPGIKSHPSGNGTPGTPVIG